MPSGRVVIILAFVGLWAVCDAQQRSSLDTVDIDSVFRNERLLKNYVDCLLDKKPCSKEGAELKKRIPNVLANNCDNCSQTERERAVKVIRTLASRRPELWAQVKGKFDPTGQYAEHFSKQYNIRV